jgi:hypothetical protein
MKTHIDVVPFAQGHTYYETFECYVDRVTEPIAELLATYSVPGWSEPPNRWYRGTDLAGYGKTDRIGAIRQAAHDLNAFLAALVTAEPSLDDSVATASLLEEVSA